MIDLTDAQSQYISFGTLAAVQGLSSRTFLAWVNFDALAGAHAQAIAYPLYGTGTNEYWDVGIAITSKKLYTQVGWSSVVGGWATDAAMTTGIHHLGITYSNSSTSNDPIIYVDGASVAITESATPSGTYRSGTTTTTYIGATNTGVDYNINGKVMSMLIYNRIMGAAEILDAYNSRLAIPSFYGLVFAPNLSGATGLQVFDGATLAAGNTIADQINGASGVPAGSPGGISDTYLTYGDS